jgi:hypothetical protein
MSDHWEWPDSLDAVTAAPNLHRVVFENDEVRVLEVMVEPGVREPEHTHRWPSVMVTDQRARIHYFTGAELTFESPDPLPERPVPLASWLEPEGPHSVENIDTVRLHALRFELKPRS